MSSETATPQSSGPSWIGVLAASVAIVVVIALLLPAVQQAREAARRTQWRNNLKQVGLAFHNYADSHHCLPPGGIFAEDGTAFHGWMTSLSPYLDASPFYSSVDFHIPWDHPEQLGKFAKATYVVYVDPSMRESKTIDGLPQVHLAANQWLMHRNSSVSLSQVSDTAQTLLAADAYGSFPPMGYPYVWRDPEIPLQTDPWQFGSSVRDITHILYADGHVGALASTVDPAAASRCADLHDQRPARVVANAPVRGVDRRFRLVPPVSATAALLLPRERTTGSVGIVSTSPVEVDPRSRW
ncbi:MAG: hypothetical protein B7Z55_01750 [Planctomycetales bacterium 12-60-4]|nr:MAG: hypothetical protein B7Z55_01750 [Planctomycetales bacterium 12-60-4]